MLFAKIDNGVVVNKILADAEFIASDLFKADHPGLWIEVGEDVQIGWTCDAETKKFSAPVVNAPQA